MDTDAPTAVSAQSLAEAKFGSVKQQLVKLFKESLKATFPDESNVEPLIAISQKFDDYQCNNSMVLWSKVKEKSTEFKGPQSIAEALVKNLPHSAIIEKTSVNRGFINIALSREWISRYINRMINEGIGIWAPILPVTRAVVDFSSPNIAKEMHVGHLRSTIIGDTLARMLEYSNVEVLRRNHVGDWGTQFGMLIQYVFDKFPDWEETGENDIADLQRFYKESKLRFDTDSSFKAKAQRAVVKLQSGDPRFHKAWTKMCEISRNEFNQLYARLDIKLEEKGESFYNPYIPGVLEELTNKKLIKESEGARVIVIEGQNIPFIVVKSDGGYNYASTDLACLRYRINEEKAQWIVYVTDIGQAQHFEMLFSAAKMAGWLSTDDRSYPKTSHVGFGLVLGDDRKRFRTRSTEVVRLIDLLDEAKNRAEKELIQRLESNGKRSEWSDKDVEETAIAVGYGAVKYADLKNNRLTNYQFSYDAMLNDKGNTAVYLQYAHARICSIIRKSGKNIEDLKKTGSITLGEKAEEALGVHLVQFSEVVEDACTNLLPSTLCDYLYKLSEIFNTFYGSCPVVGSEQETSRLLLCEATVIVMRTCFNLLGIEPVHRL